MDTKTSYASIREIDNLEMVICIAASTLGSMDVIVCKSKGTYRLDLVVESGQRSSKVNLAIIQLAKSMIIQV